MATEILAGSLGEQRAASTAGGGLACTTAAKIIELPLGTRRVRLIPRAFSTAVVVKYAVNPYLAVLVTGDALATATDYSDAAQDGSLSTGVTLNSLDTAANLDYIYLGSHLPFRGVQVDVQNTNSIASVLSGEYRKNDGTWAALSVTDGTVSTGVTLAIDGAITWTLPTDWDMATLVAAVATTGAAVPQRSLPLFWARLKVSVQLDSTVSCNSIVALNRSTLYAELPSGFDVSFAVTTGIGGSAAIEALTDAGTANLIINVSSGPSVRFA